MVKSSVPGPMLASDAVWSATWPVRSDSEIEPGVSEPTGGGRVRPVGTLEIAPGFPHSSAALMAKYQVVAALRPRTSMLSGVPAMAGAGALPARVAAAKFASLMGEVE